MFTRLPSIASTSCTASRHRPYGLLLAWQQPHQRKCDSLRPANGATSQHWMAWHRDAQGWQLGMTWYNWVWWTWKFIAINGNHWQTIGGWEAAWWSNGTVWNTPRELRVVQPAAANFDATDSGKYVDSNRSTTSPLCSANLAREWNISRRWLHWSQGSKSLDLC